MYQIPWERYSEEEIQEVLTALFKKKGYEVYNIHKVDRRGEQGVDLECTRPLETDKILISVKKKPRQKDVAQLNKLADKPSKTKIYVYIGEPSTAFKKAMEKMKNTVSFWDSKKLTYETFATDVRFYLFMIIENDFKQDVYFITFSFRKFYTDFVNNGPKYGKPLKADRKMLTLLWHIKDRSASLHKSLRTLQTLFEELKLLEVEDKTKMSITQAFLRSLSQLQTDSLRPLRELYLKFLKEYPANFEQFCRESEGRSNWIHLLSMRPQLSPGCIMKSFEEANKMMQKTKGAPPQTEASPYEEQLDEILGDVARILANEAYWFEDAADDLLKIGLTGKCR
ncbi:MAG: restriction endonuclease [Candidatus Bathycorpusculaceae bacterium]